MEHPKVNTPGRPVVVPVFTLSIPDVTSRAEDSGADLRPRTKLVRLGADQNTSDLVPPKKKKLVLFSVFCSYALVGVVAAKLTVWLLGGASAHSKGNTSTLKDTTVPSRAVADFAMDPAVSEGLRIVLKKNNLPEVFSTDQPVQNSEAQDATRVNFIDW